MVGAGAGAVAEECLPGRYTQVLKVIPDLLNI